MRILIIIITCRDYEAFREIISENTENPAGFNLDEYMHTRLILVHMHQVYSLLSHTLLIKARIVPIATNRGIHKSKVLCTT